MRLIGKIWIVVVCAMLLVACGGQSESELTPEAATPPVSTPPPIPEMDVGSIVWTEEIDPDTGEPTSIVTGFTTQSPAIIAVIEIHDIPQGSDFSATWTINDQPIEIDAMDITASEDMPHAWIAFSFTRDEDQRYPVGQLSVVITTSEGHLREGSVEIGFP